MVGGLLLRGMSNRVVTPPVAAADVAAAMPAQPHEAVCFDLNVQACNCLVIYMRGCMTFSQEALCCCCFWVAC